MSPPLRPPFYASNFNTKFDGKIAGTEKCTYICSGIRNQKNNHHVYNYSRNNQESL